TATVKLVDRGQSDMGFPSPGVFSLGLEQGIKIVSVWEMGATDVFDFAFPKGKAVSSLKQLEGKTIVIGSAGWRAIVDPMVPQAGIGSASIQHAAAGNTWGQVLAQGTAEPAFRSEGLRSQSTRQGLHFDS